MFCIAPKNDLVFLFCIIKIIGFIVPFVPLWFLIGPVLKFCPSFHMHIYFFLSLCEYCTLDLIFMIHGGTINV